MTPREHDGGKPAPTAGAVVKAVTLLALLGVWGIITVGIAFELAEYTQTYRYLTLFVAILVSRYWGVPARLFTSSR